MVQALQARCDVQCLEPQFRSKHGLEQHLDDIGRVCQHAILEVVIGARDASGQTVVVGTEFGIFVTEDGGTSWNISNMGVEVALGDTPVFDLKQQFRDSHEWSNITNSGAIYAGTHGRGMFVSGLVSSVEEEVADAEEASSWSVFPNPVMSGELNLPTAGWQGNAQVEIYDMTGRSWISENVQLSGVERIRTDVQGIPSGHYVVRMAQEEMPRRPNLWCASEHDKDGKLHSRASLAPFSFSDA